MFRLFRRRVATRVFTSRHLLTAAIFAASSMLPQGPANAQHAGRHHHMARGATSADTPVVAEYKAAHERMMRAMDLPYTGDPDVDFRTHMIPHHAGAMDMARIAMRHAKNPWTRQLAESVIYEQQREITEMQGWLARHGVAAPQSGQPYHVLTTGFVRGEPKVPGTRDELVGQSWAPGLGIPGAR